MKTRNQRLRRALVLATVAGAIAAPGASASPVDPFGVNSGYRVHSPDTGGPPPEPGAAAADGFDWGDAGIGAAGMFAVVAIAAGATIAAGHRPSRGHTVA